MRVHGHAILTRVSADTRKLLDAACVRHGVRLSELLREAIADRLEAEGVDLPREFSTRRIRTARPCQCNGQAA